MNKVFIFLALCLIVVAKKDPKKVKQIVETTSFGEIENSGEEKNVSEEESKMYLEEQVFGNITEHSLNRTKRKTIGYAYAYDGYSCSGRSLASTTCEGGCMNIKGAKSIKFIYAPAKVEYYAMENCLSRFPSTYLTNAGKCYKKAQYRNNMALSLRCHKR